MDNDDMTRRDFVTMTVAAGLAGAGTKVTGLQPVGGTNVAISEFSYLVDSCDPYI
jgi:hypothetical protein